MISYEEIKRLLADKENKQKIVMGVCFVLVFIIGYGTGKFKEEINKPKQQLQSNYTTKVAPAATPVPAPAVADEAGTGGQEQVLGTTINKPCLIKGNASSKIYHVQGGAFYSTLKSPRCFATEAEAKAAGYRKSGR